MKSHLVMPRLGFTGLSWRGKARFGVVPGPGECDSSTLHSSVPIDLQQQLFVAHVRYYIDRPPQSPIAYGYLFSLASIGLQSRFHVGWTSGLSHHRSRAPPAWLGSSPHGRTISGAPLGVLIVLDISHSPTSRLPRSNDYMSPVGVTPQTL